MDLVLVSRSNLDDLQKVVEDNFVAVENKDLPPKDFSDAVCFDSEHSFGRIFKVVPDK